VALAAVGALSSRWADQVIIDQEISGARYSE